MECDRIFVYGTLRRAARPDIHRQFLGEKAEFVGAGRVAGRLWRVDWYPALTEAEAEGEEVRGELYRLKDPVASLAELDRFEVCDLARPEVSEYTRRVVPVQMHDGSQQIAWCYFYLGSVAGLKRIESGDFAADSV